VEFYAGYGIHVEKVMTDNGSPYISRVHAVACRELHLKHLRTQPYRPRTNGKAERFIQTLSTRVGLRPRLPEQPPAHHSPQPMANPLQLHKTTRRPQPPTPRHTTGPTLLGTTASHW
jgi:hypothetical protein